jgi:hypothetical protein
LQVRILPTIQHIQTYLIGGKISGLISNEMNRHDGIGKVTANTRRQTYLRGNGANKTDVAPATNETKNGVIKRFKAVKRKVAHSLKFVAV